MKKEIMSVVNSENATLKVTQFGTLRRWTKDAIGTPVDKLAIEISIKERRMIPYEIKSRTYSEIIEEIDEAIKDYFDTISSETRSAFRNGRLY